jgi:hypothetical protein
MCPAWHKGKIFIVCILLCMINTVEPQGQWGGPETIQSKYIEYLKEKQWLINSLRTERNNQEIKNPARLFSNLVSSRSNAGCFWSRNPDKWPDPPPSPQRVPTQFWGHQTKKSEELQFASSKQNVLKHINC